MTRFRKSVRSAIDQNVGNKERLISVAAGVGLLLSAMARQRIRIPLAIAGGTLLYRGMSGRCGMYSALNLTSRDRAEESNTIRASQSVTINRNRDEVYRFWRTVENYPRFMEQLTSAQSLDPRRSRFVGRTPFGTTMEWESEIIDDRPGERIAYRSVGESKIRCAGEVRFVESPSGRGTEVRVENVFELPFGRAWGVVAKLIGRDPASQLNRDLQRAKALLESVEFESERSSTSQWEAGRPFSPSSQEAR